MRRGLEEVRVHDHRVIRLVAVSVRRLDVGQVALIAADDRVGVVEGVSLISRQLALVIGQVEDVLELGQAIEVKVDDIDPQGKVSLSLVGDFPEAEGSSDREERSERREERSDRGDRGERRSDSNKASSFEASFEAELADEIGDLGPGGPSFGGDNNRRGGGRPRRH